MNLALLVVVETTLLVTTMAMAGALGAAIGKVVLPFINPQHHTQE